ncbi:TrkA-C domain protein [Pirellula staleyi DSM 6068]|uniref:TrkA-C domain protein n=1 Tax=Pirellula staleyi (strain ATCC 27377 / DSM 6068 / ICPB 4128) TaxID=530564 RepID=D2QZW6_PIRSD|nr:SLC13 family permease [Pirellula staleyi]ADB16599.1 TrkA-C domain protein [Pirellula staleyi DSM 6068]
MNGLTSLSLLAASPVLEFLGISPAIFVLVLVAFVFLALSFTTIAPDLVLIASVVILLATGVLEPSKALAGLSNEGMVTVAILFVVGAGIRETGGVDWIAIRLFGRPKTVFSAVTRLMLPTMGLSAFLNNTPLVAMLIPAVTDLSRTQRIAASKLMIPLSYAAILGGTCTLIGTSTNLVVQGLLIDAKGIESKLGLFDIAWVGVPAAIIGGIYVIFAACYLLPDRSAAISTQDDPKEYTVEMQVAPDSPLAGKSIEDAGLRHLPGLYLAEIDREGSSIVAVSPQEVLREGDRLLFVGVVESVVELQRIRGLVPATDDVFKLKAPRPQRCLIEAVVSNTCPFVGKTIRESRFRNHYNAVVVAVARNGERLHQKIGDIVLTAGDVLLVEAHPSFAEQQRGSRDFFLVSKIDQSSPPRHELALFTVALLVAMVLLVSFDVVSMLVGGLVVAATMLITRCLSIEGARRSVDWEVLLAIAAAFALGQALEVTGADKMIADHATSLAGDSPWMSLVMIYLVTLLVTELITNNAAAALMFPFAMATADKLGVSYLPFVIAVMMAASAGFATPIGYQTNLMVYGPGGYKFSDYLKVGLPLDFLIAGVTCVIAPLVFPFK